MNFAEEIKERLPLADVVETYTGQKVNRNKITCPFHSEKTASFTLFKNNTYYCFGCGVSGDVITFTKQIHNIGFSQAILRLNTDFGLCLPLTGKYDRSELKQRQKIKEKQTAEKLAREKAEQEYWLWLERLIYLEELLKKHKPKSPDEEPNIMFFVALHWIPYAEYRFYIAENERRCLSG